MFSNSPAIGILVIEDNPADFILLRELLAETNIKISKLICAESLANAASIIREQKFDIVFLDLSLPDAIPTETFGHVKRILPDSPLIVLSGMDAVQLAQQSLREGAQDYLIKDKLDSTMLSKSVYYSIERVKHTQKLIESERRFRHIASQFPNGIIAVLDSEFRYLFAVGGEPKGLGIRAASLTGACFTDAFPAPEAERIRQLLNEAFECTNVSFEIQYAGQYYQVNTACVNNKNNPPENLLVVLQNITEAKKTAEQLRFQSEVLANITDGVVACDNENKIVYWNRTATEIFGYDDLEVIGSDISMLTDDIHDLPEKESIHAHLQEEASYETTVQLKTRTGDKIWIELKISLNIDTANAKTGLIYVLKDVSERKAEEHLLTLFQSAILNTNDAVLITEAWPDKKLKARKIVFVNNAFVRMTGYHSEEVIGNTALMFLGPETDQAELNRIRNSLNNWEPTQTELTYYRKDGSLIWVTMAITPVSDRSGRFTHWVYIQRDNTENRKTAAALKSQNEQLIKTNRELDRFVYSASHDLRAPLTSILGLLTLMNIEGNKKDVALYSDKIRESVNRLDRLIQNIINYSRNSRLVPVSNEIDFETILRNSISIHEFMSSMRDVDFCCANQLSRPFRSDAERWQIIMNNLVSNSMKFSRADKELEIQVRVYEENFMLYFVYEDNGVGIPESQMEHVFDMFYRASDIAPGSGLGLYIVKQTVETLGGKIQIESKTGSFTRFTISLPSPQQEGETHAEKSS